MAIVMVSHDIGTISSVVKEIVCVNRNVHRHRSNILTPEQLRNYDCPIQVISHGTIHTPCSNTTPGTVVPITIDSCPSRSGKCRSFPVPLPDARKPMERGCDPRIATPLSTNSFRHSGAFGARTEHSSPDKGYFAPLIALSFSKSLPKTSSISARSAA